MRCNFAPFDGMNNLLNLENIDLAVLIPWVRVSS